MHHVRGNHDAMMTQTIAVDAPRAVTLDGVTLAILDTVRPGTDRGRVSAEQLQWLDDLAAESTQPILVFGHHHPWDPSSHERNETYFGINPDDSEALCAVIDRRAAIAGYFAGHTHRTRTRHFPQARNVPIIEIACVKDYPGAWAEYRCTRADTYSSRVGSRPRRRSLGRRRHGRCSRVCTATTRWAASLTDALRRLLSKDRRARRR